MSAERSVGRGDDSRLCDRALSGGFVLTGGTRQEAAVARQVRARELVAGRAQADIAAAIASECGSSRIRAYRLALGIALADVVAQVRARYEADGRRVPRFSETLLSAYESGQKRPGPEYLHYLCAIYQADPADLGLGGRCLCGRSHRHGRCRRQSGPCPLWREVRGAAARHRPERRRRCAGYPDRDGPAPTAKIGSARTPADGQDSMPRTTTTRCGPC